MSDIARQTLDTAKIVVLAALLVVGVQYVFAAPWTGPNGEPPTNNVEPPVNVSGNEQEKTGLLNVGGLVSRYGITAQGNISGITGTFSSDLSASAGTFSGEVSGTSISAGSGAITGGQGIFSGGVTIGTPDGTAEYLHLDNKSVFGNPVDADCDTQSEGGRMYYDSTVGLLYLCVQERTNDAENGWKPVAVEYVPTQQ